MSEQARSGHVPQTALFRWDGVEVKAYKADGTHFARITRQTLFEGGGGITCELRYFEIAPGGWSSLERHRHGHAVMIVRGRSMVLLGDRVVEAGTHDLVRVPPLTWHQFQPVGDEPLGFLCMVECERDRPERPDAAALDALRGDPAIAAWLRV